MKRCAATATACLVLLCIGAAAAAQERRGVEIWSDGTRLAGDLWLPEGLAADAKRPAIVLAQGWGGVREQLNGSYATAFAQAGFIVLTFDYRGWGDSESRLVLVEPEPAPDADGLITVRARPIREVVDPQDQILDILNVVAFLRGEPQVAADRIGLWGTSYGGGHVVEVAAREPRIAAVVAQVAYMGVSRSPEQADLGRQRAVQKARGEIDPIPQGIDRLGQLRGTPDLAKMVGHRPIDNAHRVRAATLVIDVEDDEYFDVRANGRAVYEAVRGNAPGRYEVYSGTHYAIYGVHYQAALSLAIAWFTAHLGGEG
jgi:dienelactone hydrolase